MQPNMTTETAPAPQRRTFKFNRRARALAEAEALGIDLRDPFAELSPAAEDSLDVLIYGRAWAGLI